MKRIAHEKQTLPCSWFPVSDVVFHKWLYDDLEYVLDLEQDHHI